MVRIESIDEWLARGWSAYGRKQIVWKVGVGLVAGGWVRNGGGKVCFQCIFEKLKYF